MSIGWYTGVWPVGVADRDERDPSDRCIEPIGLGCPGIYPGTGETALGDEVDGDGTCLAGNVLIGVNIGSGRWDRADKFRANDKGGIGSAVPSTWALRL